MNRARPGSALGRGGPSGVVVAVAIAAARCGPLGCAGRASDAGSV
jgi:hypothetical protein